MTDMAPADNREGSSAATTWQQGQGWTCHRCATQVRVGEIHLCTNQKQGGLKP